MSAHEVPADDEGRALRVRPYAITGGRTRPQGDLPLEAQVRTTPAGRASEPNLVLERRRIVELCGEPLSVAEVSAHLGVPIGVARVLVGDMASEGLLETSGGLAITDDRPDIKLLERVLDGLHAL